MSSGQAQRHQPEGRGEGLRPGLQGHAPIIIMIVIIIVIYSIIITIAIITTVITITIITMIARSY